LAGDGSPASIALVHRPNLSRTTAPLLVLAAAGAFALAPARARAAVDLLGCRSIGMGGAGIAAGYGETAVLLNPAALTLKRAYVVSGAYEYRVSDDASLLNIGISDSSTSTLAAGLAYSYAHSTPSWLVALEGGGNLPISETIDANEAALALAYPLFNLASVGVTTRYLNRKVSAPEGTPSDLVEQDLSTVSLDVGATLTLFGSLMLGVVGYNLVPTHDAAYPTNLGVGAAYAFGSRFLFEFDAHVDFTSAPTTKASFHGGGELGLSEYLALRAGFTHSTLREATYVTGGASLNLKKFSIDFGLRQMVKGGAETLLAFGLKLALE
jgi:hypothetical protein